MAAWRAEPRIARTALRESAGAQGMLEAALVAFTTLFATVGPPDVAVIFAAITAGCAPRQRRLYALKGTLIGGAILLCFVIFGRTILASFGISLAALRTAGGILLLLIAIDLVFARSSGGTSTTPEETEEATRRQDISVFPLATPLIAGPGAIAATIVLTTDMQPGPLPTAIVVAALLAVLGLTLALMMVASELHRVLGITGVHVISRVMGLLLSALAVQFVFDGIAGSGLLGQADRVESARPPPASPSSTIL
jgi:multiple antibiotic resistance protein